VSARTKARKRAVDALFAADLRDAMPDQLLDQAEQQSDDRASQVEIFNYAREAVTGISLHLSEIDEALETYAQGWTLPRMPALDRAILRLATWEILFNDQVPDAVAIDEAVELAKEYSTDNSAGFVNGVLGKIASTRTAL
jgi:N utilization substance protein B